MVNRPSESVVAVREMPLPRPVTVTAAPGTTAPCESRTVPTTVADVIWPIAIGAMAPSITTHAATNTHTRRIHTSDSLRA